MSNRKLLLKTRENTGVRSSTETLREDIRLFKHAIPSGFLSMERQEFERHFNKLYQTNYVFTCLYIEQLSRKQELKGYQVEVIQGYFPEFGS